MTRTRDLLVAGFVVVGGAARVAAWLYREPGTGRLKLESWSRWHGEEPPEWCPADLHVLYDEVALRDSFAHVEIDARLSLGDDVPPQLAAYFDDLRESALHALAVRL